MAGMDLLPALDITLSELPPGRLLVAYSGGMDSHVLLHALASLPRARQRGLRALHVDHGLHPDSAQWADHCRRICQALDVPLHVTRVDVVPDGDGPEAAARRERWQALRDHAGDEEIVVLAQHRDDQAETVLLRLLRGAGPTGLAAMRAFTHRDDGLRVWRPWLTRSRDRLRRHAGHHALDWVDDPSNRNRDFDRNHLRLDVLPLLRQRWPQVDTLLATLAERMADAQALEHDAAHRLLAQAMTLTNDSLALPPLQQATRPQRWAALRAWLAGHGVLDSGGTRLEQIDRELIGAAIDADPRLALGDKVLRRYRQHLYLLDRDADQPLQYRIDWDGVQPLLLPDGSCLSFRPALSQPLPLQVATRRGGERLRLRAGGPHRDLRLLFQEQAVPTWLRTRWPVLWWADEPVAFADLLCAEHFAEALAQRRTTLHFQPSSVLSSADR